MRAVVPADLDHCARTLAAQPAGTQAETMARILHRADTADRYRKRTGRLLPGHGDGSLTTAAWTIRHAPPPPRCDAAYCAALGVVLAALHGWRTRAHAYS